MPPYKEMYFHLFNAITDALEVTAKGDYQTARGILIAAQQWVRNNTWNLGRILILEQNRHAIRISRTACLFVLIPFFARGRNVVLRWAQEKSLFFPNVFSDIFSSCKCGMDQYRSAPFIHRVQYDIISENLFPDALASTRPQHHMTDTYMVRMINPFESASAAACIT